ncbi:MAG: hypothetical protein IJ688_10045 [Treponema sp.]|uniref:glycoside hydrolase n=1 Tax=Treponema sp. TaxID=166 RepID=UPI0025EF28BB|nr:glycoside hydrolase [Treponema sp.]MBQ8680487.1 hypothetical protein [Treponema sp.]MBR1639712.1 hypothetical protein [Treponema sp.]
MTTSYKYIFSIIVLIFFVSCKSTIVKENSSNSRVIIDLKNISPINNGVFEGWGTSLCWWGNRLGDNSELSDKAVELFFSKEKGLGLNIIRYNIGGGDDPNHTHIKRSDSAMQGFWKNVDSNNNFDYDWSKDLAQRNILKKINSCTDDIIIEFFSNSPPYFMTKSGCSSGSITGFYNNITINKLSEFASYLAEVTMQLQSLDGVVVTSLEPMNEPNSFSWAAFNNKQEGCRISDSKSQSALLILTRRELDRRGLQNVIVCGSDEYGPDLQAKKFNELTITAKNCISRINTHTYYGKNYKKLLQLACKNNKNLWISETDAPSVLGKNNGQMGPALALAKKIIVDMNGLKPSAWIMWQVIADYLSESPFNGIIDGSDLQNFEESFWGTAIADFNNDTIILSKKYYVFGQFTKFIKPGSYVIYTENDNYIAAFDPVEKSLSIVCINSDLVENKVFIDISSFINSYKKIISVRTSGKDLEHGENLSLIDIPITSYDKGNFSLELSPNSVTTIVLKDVELL